MRLYTANPRNTELYALRLLLLHRIGPLGFTDLRSINCEKKDCKDPKHKDGKHICETFTEAAQLDGLLDSDDQWKEVMEDAIIEKMNKDLLIRHFAQLLYYHTPSQPRKMFDYFLDKIIPQPLDGKSIERSKKERTKQLLYKCEYYLRKMGGSCV